MAIYDMQPGYVLDATSYARCLTADIPCHHDLILDYTHWRPWSLGIRRLHHERLSATALFLDIRIAKLETLVEIILDPVHLAANNTEQRFAVNQNPNSILLNSLVVRPGLVHVFEMVRQPAASAIAHSNLDELRVIVLKKLAQMCDGFVGELDGGLLRFS